MTLILKYIRFLSLDVALGGVLLSIAVARYIGVVMPASVPLCLGIAIWVIYTIDHLIDAFKSEEEPSIERHMFHKKYSRLLITALVTVVAGGIYQVLSLPTITFFYGMALLLAVLFYFVVIYFFRRFYLKEFFVAMVYALGIFVGPLSLTGGVVTYALAMVFVQVFLLALINLVLFSLFEIEQDKADKNASIVLKMGPEKTQQMLKILFALLLTVQVFVLVDIEGHLYESAFQLMFVAMTGVLFALQHWPGYFSENERYRLLGDGIFFLPAIWLLL